jgi:hypothetical protein
MHRYLADKGRSDIHDITIGNSRHDFIQIF